MCNNYVQHIQSSFWSDHVFQETPFHWKLLGRDHCTIQYQMPGMSFQPSWQLQWPPLQQDRTLEHRKPSWPEHEQHARAATYCVCGTIHPAKISTASISATLGACMPNKGIPCSKGQVKSWWNVLDWVFLQRSHDAASVGYQCKYNHNCSWPRNHQWHMWGWLMVACTSQQQILSSQHTRCQHVRNNRSGLHGVATELGKNGETTPLSIPWSRLEQKPISHW